MNKTSFPVFVMFNDAVVEKFSFLSNIFYVKNDCQWFTHYLMYADSAFYIKDGVKYYLKNRLGVRDTLIDIHEECLLRIKAYKINA